MAAGGRPAKAPAHGGSLISCDSQAKIICIFGKRGSGKTTLAWRLLHGKRRVILFDPLGQYEGDASPQGRKWFVSLYELRQHVQARDTFFAVYRPTRARESFPLLSRIACKVGKLCLVAEEISWAISPAKMNTEIENLIRYGRHRDVELIGISRRPSEVNRDLTANADEIYIFRMHEPRDKDYFRDVIGSAADGLPNLEPYIPYIWKADSAESSPQ